MSSPEFRKTILNDAKDRLWTQFSKASGTVGQWFREGRLGPLSPRERNYPIFTVSDGGQTRVDDGEDQAGSSERKLIVLVTLQLAENWERVGKNDDWSDRVEYMIASLDGFKSEGVIDMFYTRDDPADVVFTSGAAEAAWEIEFENHYFVD